MFRFGKILVAHDLGAGSDRAMERARQLAGQWQLPHRCDDHIPGFWMCRTTS